MIKITQPQLLLCTVNANEMLILNFISLNLSLIVIDLFATTAYGAWKEVIMVTPFFSVSNKRTYIPVFSYSGTATRM